MNLVILTGAGISAESGVPTFRADDGLWKGHRIEDVATPEGFARDPALVQGFYDARRRQLADGASQRRPPRPGRSGGALGRSDPAGHPERRRPARPRPCRDAACPGFDLIHMHGELLKARLYRHRPRLRLPRRSGRPPGLALPSAGPPARRTSSGSARCPLHMDRIEAALDRLRPVRLHRHLGRGLARRRLRRRCRPRRGPHRRTQSRTDAGPQPLRREALWPSDRGGAGFFEDLRT